MKPTACITTSWDDGHLLDFRVADLLTKYELPGTFYVPKASEHGTMTEERLRELSASFEIGAHTLYHVDLDHVSEQTARDEIAGSKSWIEDTIGASCQIFCPPKGHYSRSHLKLVREAGFTSVRSVELLSVAFPRRTAGIAVMPTTIQSHPHAFGAYAKNAIKRAAFRNLWLYGVHGRSTDWVSLAKSLLNHTLANGGVFHVWGHSWELQENDQWSALEEVLKYMHEATSPDQRLTNLQICQTFALDGPGITPANELAGDACREFAR